MDDQWVWQDRFNIGIDYIDEEHKKLFSIIRKLFVVSRQKEKSQWACQEGIKYLKRYVEKHFTEEEQYMQSINYQGYEMHKRLHDNFRYKTLLALQKELEEEEYAEEAVTHFLSVCSGWLIGHTLTEDQAIIGKAVSKWANLLPEEENAAMEQAISQILYDVFRLQTKVVSESYGGEKFGEGIYYRLSYATAHGDKWEVLLVLEEKLILTTLGQMMGIRFEKANTTALNAYRYVTQQIMDNLGSRFSSIGLCQLKKEDFMTYEQFRRVFDEQKPQCSLLLNTDAGYFAFCSFAPDQFHADGGVSIVEDNALEKIKSYLEKNISVQKKKILVVDDSQVMRHAIKSLLDKDYEVELAESGLAAFRCIILDKPDLVLLDYEMPVCDGRQVLEMIRAEKALADTSVIFLTGRGDEETVRQVMSLKPAGYLLKTTNPEKIREIIDGYFKKIS